MSIQTYDNYHRAYYQTHKKQIAKRTKEYRKTYARQYYLKKKEEKYYLQLAKEEATTEKKSTLNYNKIDGEIQL